MPFLRSVLHSVMAARLESGNGASGGARWSALGAAVTKKRGRLAAGSKLCGSEVGAADGECERERPRGLCHSGFEERVGV